MFPRAWFAAALLFVPAASAVGAPPTLGYNIAWIEGKYGRDLSAAYDPRDWERVFARARSGGGEAVRVWLCEGRAREGVRWEGARPVGVDSGFLERVGRVAARARSHGLRVYWTLLSGNWPAHWGRDGLAFERWRGLLCEGNPCAEAFRQEVIGPILDVLAREPDACYGLDLLNEVQGALRAGVWPRGWCGARRWLQRTAAFVHARAPWLKVTASSGHRTAVRDLLWGRFDRLGLDFHDVHAYDDRGRLPWGVLLALRTRARGLPLVLGEFGQASSREDAPLQARATEGFLQSAERLGLAAAFAWRLEDRQPRGRRFAYYADGAPRPALGVARDCAERWRSGRRARSCCLRRLLLPRGTERGRGGARARLLDGTVVRPAPLR